MYAQKRQLAENAQKKRMLAAINSVKHLRKTTQQAHIVRENARAERQRALRQKDKNGLIGRRLGKHKVPKGEIDVQLGEELSESLRGIKASLPSINPDDSLTYFFFGGAQPEGNLFRDRFLSLQHRALLEPRLPVLWVWH
jgi:nucleolar protein 53